jgi:glycosyltransferase involved in cell wall biosynthesis
MRTHGRRGPPRHRLNPADITFVVLTKDEERRIDDCLRSQPESAPRLVYDAQSTDSTASVARALGAEVVSRPWVGFAQARLDAASLVRTPWTFMLDADERLTPELRAELVALNPPAEVDAYSVARMNFFCGRWMRCAGWWPDRLVRLFRTGRAALDSRNANSAHALHETWRVDGACVELRAPLEHHSYATVDSYRSKFALYTALEANGLRGGVGVGSLIAGWLLVPVRALWLLIGRRGLLEGWRGIYVSIASACYPAVVKTKARSD